VWASSTRSAHVRYPNAGGHAYVPAAHGSASHSHAPPRDAYARAAHATSNPTNGGVSTRPSDAACSHNSRSHGGARRQASPELPPVLSEPVHPSTAARFELCRGVAAVQRVAVPRAPTGPARLRPRQRRDRMRIDSEA
jgi:hypothetical protein